jgi:beta-lactamase class D
MYNLKIIFFISLIFNYGFAHDEDIKNIFKGKDVKGTLVVSSLKKHTHYSNDHTRAYKGYLPASTFKILNTLIALDEKVIKDENEVIKWDGVDRGYKPWNRDHTLKTALPYSCI